MGTNLQEVFDAFFSKFPNVDFTGKESQVVQFLKSAIGKCYRRVYDNLTYEYDDILKEGSFVNIVSNPSIELLSMFMAKEYITQKYAVLCGRKQYLGTQAFSKIPSLKEEFDTVEKTMNYWINEVDMFLNEFPDYSDER